MSVLLLAGLSVVLVGSVVARIPRSMTAQPMARPPLSAGAGANRRAATRRGRSSVVVRAGVADTLLKRILYPAAASALGTVASTLLLRAFPPAQPTEEEAQAAQAALEERFKSLEQRADGHDTILESIGKEQEAINSKIAKVSRRWVLHSKLGPL